MTPRTPQCEVFWSSKSSSEFSGVPEDSNPNFFQVLGFTSTLGQSRVATIPKMKRTVKFGITMKMKRSNLKHSQLLKEFKCESQTKNNRRVSTLPGLQHL
jgi:hypothetical protein